MKNLFFKVCPPILILFFMCLTFSAHAGSIKAESSNSASLKGHGIVKFKGDGKISINGEGVIYIDENGQVDLEGFSSFFENEEDGKRVYIIPDGNIQIEGEALDVSFYGAGFGYNVTVTGKSELYAKGYGYYRVGINMGVLSNNGVTILLGD